MLIDTQNDTERKEYTDARSSHFAVATDGDSVLLLNINKDGSNNDAVVVNSSGAYPTTIAAVLTRPHDYKPLGGELSEFVMSPKSKEWEQVFVFDGELDEKLLKSGNTSVEESDWIKDLQNALAKYGISVGSSMAPETPKPLRGKLSDMDAKLLVSVRRFQTHDIIELKAGSYTKPRLREAIKKRIMAGDKGGKAGQWSARKAQMLAQEYARQGGGYKGKPKKSQRSLKKWTSEEWTTSDGEPAIRKGGTNRYLPKKAWAKLTPGERAATNRKKRAASKRGEQFVANTRKARRAGAKVRRTVVKSELITSPNIEVTQEKNLRRMVGRATNMPNVRKPGGRRSWIPQTERDGDGDGFRVNPLTGRDDLPVLRSTTNRDDQNNDPAWIDMMRELGIDPGSTGRDSRRRRAEFNPDDLGLPQRERRAKPDPWAGMSSGAGEIEREVEDPFDSPRTRVRLDGVRASDYTQLELIIAVNKLGDLIQKHNLQHRERGRLARLQRALQNLEPKAGPDSLYLDLNPELVKRLYKGMQTLKDLGELDSIERGDALYAAIKDLYRGGLPAEDAKSDYVVTEVKAFGFGRRAGRGVRRMIERPRWDGDKDNKITNPLTGLDEIPWNPSLETPEEAIERFMRETPNGGRRQRRLDQIVPGIGKRQEMQARPATRQPLVRPLRTDANAPGGGSPDILSLLGIEPSLTKPQELPVPEARWQEMPPALKMAILGAWNQGNVSDVYNLLQIFEEQIRPPRRSNSEIVAAKRNVLLNDPNIKSRPEVEPPLEKFNQIVSDLIDKYGNLTTRNDFKNAFEAALSGVNAKVKIKDVSKRDRDYGKDDDILTDAEYGSLIGHLYFADQFPESFRNTRLSISREDRYDPRGNLQYGAQTGPANPEISQLTMDLYPTFKGSIVHDLIRDSDPADTSFEEGKLDTISNQMQKRFLQDGTDGLDDDEIAAALEHLNNFWISFHENVHFAHYAAASRDFRERLETSGTSYAEETLRRLSDPDESKKTRNAAMLSIGSSLLEDDITAALSLSAMMSELNRNKQIKAQVDPQVAIAELISPDILDDEGKAARDQLLEFAKDLDLQIEGQEAAIAAVQNDLNGFMDLMTPEMLDVFARNSHRPVEHQIATVAFDKPDLVREYGEARLSRILGVDNFDMSDPAFLLGPTNLEELQERIGDPLGDLPAEIADRLKDPNLDLSDSANADLRQILEDLSKRMELEGQLLALRVAYIRSAQMGQLFEMLRDDLSDDEWKQLSSIWKYSSTYAKDRFSFYGGTLGQPVSVEGIAESLSLIAAGGKADPKNKVGGDALLARLMDWIGMV